MTDRRTSDEAKQAQQGRDARTGLPVVPGGGKALFLAGRSLVLASLRKLLLGERPESDAEAWRRSFEEERTVYLTLLEQEHRNASQHVLQAPYVNSVDFAVQ